jgi:mannose-6-phosphate isomerase
MPEPIELNPEHVSAIWGGNRLAPDVAEIWLASDLAHRPTRVAYGIHAGKSPGDALGRPLPVLAKFLDARLPLSVQVHPHDEHARARGFENGKTEAWVVLHADPGSRIYAGLHEGIGLADLAGGRIEETLYWFEPTEGDLIYLPAGTVHALGGGVTVFEIQQSCDVTYRLHDWGRVDPKSGLPRELHIEDALACISEWGPVNPRRGERSLVTPFFELHVHRDPATIGGDGRPRLLIAYGGDADGCVRVPAGRAIALASSEGELRVAPSPGGWLFECIIP